MAVFGYVRVSTSRQADEGESLDVQHRVIAGYALMMDLKLDRVFVERGVSGSVPLLERLEGSALMTLSKRGDVVITAKLDRMFRSALDALNVLADFKRQGVALHMIDLGGDVTSNGISKLIFTILSAVAEAERDRIRERITQVKADQKIRGKYLGGPPPYGYRVKVTPLANGKFDKTLEEDPVQQDMINQIKDLFVTRRMSLRAIKTTLKLNLSIQTIASIIGPNARLDPALAVAKELRETLNSMLTQ